MQHFTPDFDQLKDVELKPIDKDDIISGYKSLSEELQNASEAKKAIETVKKYFDYEDDFMTILSLVNFRYTCNTADEKYSAMWDLLNEILPSIEEASQQFTLSIFESKYHKELVNAFGQLYFDKIALSQKTSSPEIVEDKIEENKLVSEYVKLTSSAMISFEGKEYSLTQMGQFTSSSDRNIRLSAFDKVWKFYEENDEKIGTIFDSLVKVRTRIAKKLGYKNFVQLGYDRMGRLDWTPKDGEEYRKKILKYVVPLSNKLDQAQIDRLGYGKDMRFADFAIFYKSGNPLPKGNQNDLVNAAKRMYQEMDLTASKYFNFMVDHGCMDLDARPNKAGGGFMDYIASLKTSVILANFDGTSEDVYTLTHEFGHALQGFLGAEETDVPAYRCPGQECAEMHSMSMEFLTYPWMEFFFKEDADKYRYMHLAGAITFIPYGCTIDAFQAYVYENPELKHEERKAYWHKLEREYLPLQEYGDNTFLSSGGYWEAQSAIFEVPFYYLDYTIAQIVSLEFFLESLSNYRKALDKYIAFSRLGGKYSFRKLLSKARITNPLDGDTLKNVSEKIMAYLDTFDPEKLDK